MIFLQISAKVLNSFPYQRFTAGQTDRVDVEGVLKIVDAIPVLVAFLVEEVAVDGVVMSVA